MSDLSAFEMFRRSPSPDSLIALLRAHQDGVYTVCLHVLRHPQDAEDAAQEALTKIVSGAGELKEPRAFKSWLYRLVYRTAVDHLRRRDARRRNETGRAAVTERPLAEDARVAVHEAMIRLPDVDRLLLVEHYFEKTPLEELGRREGITKVAVWKRIERAKERLKRGLAGMGVTLGGSEVSGALEAVTPATAPPGLVGSAIASKAALLAAGGLAVGMTKSGLGAVAVACLLIGLLAGLGGYHVMAGKRIEPAAPKDSRGTSRDDKAAASTVAPRTAASNAEGRAEAAPSPGAKNSLRATLEKYKALKSQWRLKPRPSDPEEDRTLAKIEAGEIRRLTEGLRELVFEDPSTFLGFIRDPKNAEVSDSLIRDALNRFVKSGPGGDNVFFDHQHFTEFPGALMDGLRDLLRSERPGHREATLDLFAQVSDIPADVALEFRALLADPSPAVQAAAIRTVSRGRPLTPEVFEEVVRVFNQSADLGVRQEAAEKIAFTPTKESEDWLLTQLEVNRDRDLIGVLARGVSHRLQSTAYVSDPAVVDRLAAGLTTAARLPTDEVGYTCLVGAALYLPADKAASVLGAALQNAPSPKLGGAVSRLLEKLRTGGTIPRGLIEDFRRMRQEE